MKLKIVVLFIYHFLQFAFAQIPLQAAPTPNYLNKTLYKSIEILSPTLHSYIQNSVDSNRIIDLFDTPENNLTLFLPNETILNDTLHTMHNNQLSYDTLSFLILNGSHSKKSFLTRGRQFYTPLQPPTIDTPLPRISIGPLLVNFEQTDKVELFSGLTRAQISGTTEISCRNGMIHSIDGFLYPAQSPLVTISIIDETESMENLLKSLNVSDVISGENKTVLAPISDAWTRAQGTSIPYGTLVNTLKYLVIDGLYTTDQIINMMNSNKTTILRSNYKKTKLEFSLNAEKKLVINDRAMIVRSDVLTTTGIIHLIDDVFLPTEVSTMDDSNSNSNSNNDTARTPVYPFYSSDSNRKSSFSSSSVTATNINYLYHCIFVLILLYPENIFYFVLQKIQ